MQVENLRDFINYLAHEKGLQESSIKAYKNDLKKFFIWVGDRTPFDLTGNQLREYTRNLSKNGGASNKTVARHQSTLRVFYKWASIENLITRNPTDCLITPKIKKSLPVYLTSEEIEKMNELLLAEQKDMKEMKRNTIVSLMLHCGLRSMEVTGLTFERIETENHQPVRLKVMGKGRKERIVPIPELIRGVLKTWLIHRQDLKNWNYAREYKRTKEYIDSSYVFSGLHGGRLSYRSVESNTHTCCKRAGVKDISPHKLRHTYATNLGRKGASLKIVKDLMGHESIVTTEIYTHVTNQEAENHLHEVYAK